MSRVMDFLEKMGSEARWRHASAEEIGTALASAGIEASLCSAILAKSADDVRGLLGQRVLNGTQTPTPSPLPREEPNRPEPDEDEDEEEGDDETSNSRKSSTGACGSPVISLHSSP